MTPAQVDELDPGMYDAMTRYAARAQRDERRAARAARRGR